MSAPSQSSRSNESASGPKTDRRIKALVLDRDGTLIVHVPYLHEPARVELLPGVHQGLRRAVEAGLLLFLHTNQSGVGRGYFSMSAVEACNRRMIELLGLGEKPFVRICIATEVPDQPSVYRKPSPAFLYEVAAEHDWPLEALCCIGDRAADLAAAEGAGARAIGVATGCGDLRAEVASAKLRQVYPIFDRFDVAIEHALSLGPSPAFPRTCEP